MSKEKGFNIPLALELASIDQIVDELFKRYPHVVVLGMKDGLIKDETIELRFKQGLNRVIQGLCMGMIIRLEQDTELRRTPTDTDQ